MHVGIAGVLAERNELDAAREQLELSRRLGEYNGLPQHPYRWRVTAARVAAADGDLDRAATLLEEAGRVYVGDFAPNVQPVAAVLARLRIRRGELSAARDWARESRVDAADGPQYLREYEHLTLARLLVAQYPPRRRPG